MDHVEKRIITQADWAAISDALFQVRKAYNKPNYTSDEERLEIMERHLTDAVVACQDVRIRWNLGGRGSD